MTTKPKIEKPTRPSHITIRPRNEDEKKLFAELGGARWFHEQLDTIAAVRAANRKERRANPKAQEMCFKTQALGAEVKLSFVDARHADAFTKLGLNGFLNFIIKRELQGLPLAESTSTH